MKDFKQKYYEQFLIFLCALFFSLIAYGFSLSNHTISIDVDVMDNYLHTIDLGRWGHAILKRFVFHEPWVPFFSLAFALLCMSFSAVVISKYLKLNIINSLVFSSLFVTFPQMAYQLQFSNQAETVGLALLFCSASLLIYSSGGIKNYAYFILINIFVISVYQSFVFLPVTLVTLLHLKMVSDGKNTINEWVKDSVTISILTTISVCFYFLISKQFKSYYHINDVSYFSNLIAWGKIGFFDAAIGVFKFIIYQCYLVTWYGFNLYFLTAIAVAIILIKSVKFGIKYFITTAIISFSVIISPFILNILIGSGTPARTLSQMPLVFAATMSIGMQCFKKEEAKLFFALLISLSGCSYVNILFYSDYISENQTKIISESIIYDMNHSYPETTKSQTPVFFYGKLPLKNPWKPNGADEFGISFYERGYSDRVGNYIKNTGMADILQVSPTDINENQKKQLVSMPVYPDKGYIKKVDDKVLVKLSE
ncbi:MAG: glucosyltransferase domain-containing protein [Enterobacteriaceae bacterium]|nr:glucosyltransferase domain-containing protein [Enterobacteriaceae bacterium]